MSKYSVVHFGPLKYTNSIISAYSFRDKCYGRGYFYDPDTKKKVPVKRGELTIYDLEKDTVVSDK